MSESEMAVFEYRLGQSEAFRTVRREQYDLGRELDLLKDTTGRHTEQISGDGGLQKQVHAVREELSSIRRALYALTGSIIVGTITLATAIATHAL